MKKVLLTIGALGVFALAGCSSDSGGGKNEQSNPPTKDSFTITEQKDYSSWNTNIASGDDLIGKYQIQYFMTDASVAKITTDTSKDKGVVKITLNGYGQVTKDAHGKFIVETKTQFTADNGYGTLNVPGLLEMVQEGEFNYTKFKPVAFSNSKLNESNTVKGITGGRGKTKLTDTSADKAGASEYEFTAKQGKNASEIVITNNMTDKSGLMPANVKVVMVKIDSNTSTIDPNTQFETPAITGFLTTPNPAGSK